MSEHDRGGADEGRDKGGGDRQNELIRNNEVMPEEAAGCDELRAWLAVVRMALADLTRAYREYAWAARGGKAHALPRTGDPVYTWAERVLRAVPAALYDGVPGDEVAAVEARVRAGRSGS